ncbi:protein-L-isoaspartate O-methyltransferase-domain-containing protein [Russula dissimulans]|nr:protein-L-isoaspartate O-methyltransferase-domain-containing protein [Russula dissimulans]
MAWSCSGTTNAELISNLIRNKLIKSDAVAAVRAPSHLNRPKCLPHANLYDVLTLQAMTAVDRANYVPDAGKRHAYQDSPQLIGHDATISAPHMHAHTAELLLPYLRGRPDGRSARVLDVGAGSGYLTSVFYHLVRDGRSGGGSGGGGDNDASSPTDAQQSAAHVVGIEHIPALTALAQRNIRSDGLGDALDSQRIVLVTGDGRLGAWPFPSSSSSSSSPPNSPLEKTIQSQSDRSKWWRIGIGYPPKGPYDAIHVGAAAATIPPALVEQLACPGRMIIPVGTHSQRLMQVDKDAQGKITQKDLFGVVYVPLTDRPV